MECTTSEYIRSKESLTDKICAIEAIISDMYTSMADNIGNTGTVSYSMDDGQMKVMTQYRSIEEMAKGIRELEKILQIYISGIKGRVTVMRGRKNY